ncbi:2766_t:CDS:1, partial [Diversispora eburnea]
SSACSELPVTSQAQKVDPIESLSTSPPIENHSEQIANTIAIISSNDSISVEEKEVDEFVDLKYKERVSNEIIQNIKEKKLRDQSAIPSKINPVTETSHDHKIIQSEPRTSDVIPINQAQNTISSKIKVPYNQKVEQGLRCELFICANNNDSKINSPDTLVIFGRASFADKSFDIQIPEFSLEEILTGSSKITVQNIVDLFNVAMKVRQKEILYWYCYYKAYEDKIGYIKSMNNIDDKSARTL